MCEATCDLTSELQSVSQPLATTVKTTTIMQMTELSFAELTKAHLLMDPSAHSLPLSSTIIKNHTIEDAIRTSSDDRSWLLLSFYLGSSLLASFPWSNWCEIQIFVQEIGRSWTIYARSHDKLCNKWLWYNYLSRFLCKSPSRPHNLCRSRFWFNLRLLGMLHHPSMVENGRNRKIEIKLSAFLKLWNIALKCEWPKESTPYQLQTNRYRSKRLKLVRIKFIFHIVNWCQPLRSYNRDLPKARMVLRRYQIWHEHFPSESCIQYKDYSIDFEYCENTHT